MTHLMNHYESTQLKNEDMWAGYMTSSLLELEAFDESSWRHLMTSDDKN